MPVSRVYIPKPNSEKKRPLGIPTLKDRIVQEALRMILEPIWEADFSQHSYGFRPNRGTYGAISHIGNRLASYRGESYQWVVEGYLLNNPGLKAHVRQVATTWDSWHNGA